MSTTTKQIYTYANEWAQKFTMTVWNPAKGADCITRDTAHQTKKDREEPSGIALLP